MTSLTETIRVKHWQAIILLGMSGFTVGSFLSRAIAALGQ